MDVPVPEPGSPSLRPRTALEVWWSGRRWLVPPDRSFVIGRDEGTALFLAATALLLRRLEPRRR